ncbi:MAG: family 1 glycosylhydrolase [Candidatus Babeliales bacterium]
MNIQKILYLSIFSLCSFTAFSYDWYQETHFKWHENALADENFWHKLSFPQNFLWGAATSAFQIEGTKSANNTHCENSWTMHAACDGGYCKVDSKIKHAAIPQPGTACDHYDRYKEDVQLIKKAKLNSYRFSIEWSKIEPQEGIFDEDAMQHYIDLVDELIKYGIKPIPCLFHHAWPVWFDQKGAFEKAKNIPDFVEFAEYVFEKLNNKVDMWMTFNEPVGYALEGYFRGKYPPFKKWHLKLCGKVVRNMLDAHIDIYHRFKEINPKAQVGFPKVFQPLDPYYSLHPLDRYICKGFNYLLHEATLNYFKTGHFYWGYRVKKYNKKAIKALDFLGVNYYTHTVILNCKEYKRPEEMFTTNKKERSCYPEGLYRAIKRAAQLGVPLYIAENGMNDPEDLFKNIYLKKHLWVVQLALKEKIDIRGYFWWTLMDSFSWKNNTDSKMGIYSVDLASITKERILCKSFEPFINFLGSSNNTNIAHS